MEEISGLYEKLGSRKTSSGGDFEWVIMTEGLLFSVGMMTRSSRVLDVCLARIGTRTWLVS